MCLNCIRQLVGTATDSPQRFSRDPLMCQLPVTWRHTNGDTYNNWLMFTPKHTPRKASNPNQWHQIPEWANAFAATARTSTRRRRYECTRGIQCRRGTFFERLQDDIHSGVIDVVEDHHATGLRRLTSVLSLVGQLDLSRHRLISVVEIDDRQGMCHQLANVDRIQWMSRNE